MIEGFTEFGDGKADTISGITTPDDKTIIFKLTEPTGDFLYRLAMPATSPIPEEVAKCHTPAGEYGRYIITTGPYMIDGSDKLDISSCGSQKPISGFNPNTGLNLVRNPNYDPATDNPESAEPPDRFEISVNTNLDNIFDQIERGELEGSFETPPNAVLRRYLQDADIRDRLRVNAGDRIWFAYMNLTTPPFDDIHVRKAMNLVMDLEGIQRGWGGPVIGATRTHTLPESLVSLPDYDPYQQPPFAGDVEAAKAEMEQSKYDTNQDGTCDAGALQGRDQPQPQLRALVDDVADHRAVGREDRHHDRDPRGLAHRGERRPPARRPARSPSAPATAGARTTPTRSPSSRSSTGATSSRVGNTAFSLVGRDEGAGGELGITIPRAACRASTPTSTSASR